MNISFGGGMHGLSNNHLSQSKSQNTLIFRFFLFHVYGWRCPIWVIDFKIIPIFSNLSSSSFIESSLENGTFLFVLKTDFTFSFNSNLTSVFVQSPCPSEKTWRNSFFKSVINLFASVYSSLWNQLYYRKKLSVIPIS